MASEQPKKEDTGEANDSIDLDVQLMDIDTRTVNEPMDTNMRYPVDGENVRTINEYMVPGVDCNQSLQLNVLPTINASPGQNFAGSFGSPIANSVRGFSDMQNFPDGFSRVGANERRCQDQNSALCCSRTQNEGGVSDERYSSRAMQDAGGFPSHMQPNMGVFSYEGQSREMSTDLLLSVGGSSTSSRDMSSPIPWQQTDRQSIRTPSRGMLEPEKPRADYSLNTNDIPIQSFPTSFPMLNFRTPFGVPNGPLFREIRAQRYPHVNVTNFQGSPNSSSVAFPNIRNTVGAPNARITQNLLMGFPSSSSSSARIAQQLHHRQFGTFRNFSPQPSALSPFTRNRPLLEQSAQHIQADTSAAQAAANFGPLGMNIGVRPANQEMPAGNLPTLHCRFSPGTSHRRDATTHSSNARKVQFSKSGSIRPSGHPSSLIPQMFNISRRLPSPSVNWLPDGLLEGARNRGLPSPSMNWPPDSSLEVIKADYAEPMGMDCYICKRDLSFSPEGSIEDSELLVPSAVLPCGHHFHDFCLKRITPEDQAADPPCISCAMDQKD